MKFIGRLTTVLGLALLLLACDSNHRRVRVAVISAIAEPSNLHPSAACCSLWATLMQAGKEMDDFSSDWNYIILKNSYALIEGECVRSPAPE